MEYNKDKVDEMVLALMYLTTFKDEVGMRVWKGLDWDVLDRLHEKGYISKFATASPFAEFMMFYPIPQTQIMTLGNDENGEPYLTQNPGY